MVRLSKSLKSQTSNSILNISPLSVHQSLIPPVELWRRVIYTNHISFKVFCVEIAEYLVFKVGLILSFSVRSFSSSSPKIKSFKNFNLKTICPIFFRIAQKFPNMFVSILIKFHLILLNSFLILGGKVGPSTSTLRDQLHHHKFHVIFLATMFLCPTIAFK